MNSKESFGWGGERKKFSFWVLGERRGEEKRGNRVGKTSTLPYTDLESFFRESLDIIAKVLLQIISYMLFQHLVLSPIVLCSGTIERKEKKTQQNPYYFFLFCCPKNPHLIIIIIIMKTMMQEEGTQSNKSQ